MSEKKTASGEKAGPNSDLDNQQKELEVAILRENLRQLQRPWWQRPANLASSVGPAIAIVTALGALAGTIATFSIETKRREVERDALKVKLEQLSLEKTKLEARENELKSKNESLLRQNQGIEAIVTAGGFVGSDDLGQTVSFQSDATNLDTIVEALESFSLTREVSSLDLCRSKFDHVAVDTILSSMRDIELLRRLDLSDTRVTDLNCVRR